MPMNWDGEADLKLLLAILKTQNVTVDFDTVAQELSTPSVVCTPRAVQERLKKLKKMATNRRQVFTSRAASPSADGVAGPKQKVATPRKKKATEGDDEVESPAKKRKVATPQKPTVKDELTAALEPTEGVAVGDDGTAPRSTDEDLLTLVKTEKL
ncbi:hypothetical protein B0A49_09166 [Cryomyces minteri]|uniref:Uncharacterized protein n=1 Tax=Cryomyces minteri TaxID=331657 RepID=A0A4U0WNH3_9PEZI|nr:hypothetical protein B0A49_09166 [Cryomyces minteri]